MNKLLFTVVALTLCASALSFSWPWDQTVQQTIAAPEFLNLDSIDGEWFQVVHFGGPHGGPNGGPNGNFHHFSLCHLFHWHHCQNMSHNCSCGTTTINTTGSEITMSMSCFNGSTTSINSHNMSFETTTANNTVWEHTQAFGLCNHEMDVISFVSDSYLVLGTTNLIDFELTSWNIRQSTSPPHDDFVKNTKHEHIFTQ